MRENCTSGSVRGAPGNGRSYREIVRKDSAYRRAEFDRRQQARLEGSDIWIVSKEDLVLSKLIWAAPTRSEMQLRDVRNLLISGVDRDYLQRWSKELDVSELLEACLDD